MRLKVTDEAEIETATQSDLDYVTANFRDGDRAECDLFGGKGDTIDLFEKCWVVHLKGEVVGYCGVATLPGCSWLSPIRFLCFMSCKAADGMKRSFVRASRPVMKAVVEQTPPWVEMFVSAPVEDYKGTIIWHDRVLGMHRIGAKHFKGHGIIFYMKTREEVMA